MPTKGSNQHRAKSKKNAAMLEGRSDENLQELAAHARCWTFAGGETIVGEADPIQACYAVLIGMKLAMIKTRQACVEE